MTTHGNLQHQIESLVEAWGWRADDRILHVLPLHHTHGIVNALLCALWSGAACEMPPRFDAGRGVAALRRRYRAAAITLFMAVPTVYAKLVAAWEAARTAERRAWSAAASAAPPDGVRLGGAAGGALRSAGGRSPARSCSSATG